MVLEQQPHDYNADSIQALEGIEHVRKRPGMYVGGTDIHALHHLVYEVVDNSIDEALAGRCDYIEVTLLADGGVSVNDNGRGIPVDIHKQKGISALELVMTTIGAGGKFDSKAYGVSGGLHGVGVSAVNALSDKLIAQVRRDGQVHQQTYQRGRPVSKVEVVRAMDANEPTGTQVTFYPDPSIMQEVIFNYNTLAQRFREMAFVTGGVTLTVRDERVDPFPHEATFFFEGGLKSFVYYINRNRTVLSDIIYGNKDVMFNEDDPEKAYKVGVEIAFQYTDASNTVELAFANTINTPDGGQHQSGMRTAITRTINNFARKSGLLKEKDPNFSGNDTLEGLTAIVSIKHPDPQFESQTKVKLMNPEVQGAVSSVAAEIFAEYLETHAREAKRIVEKCMTSMRARDAAKKASELVRRGSNLLENTTLPGKLADCSDRNPQNTELYIVEGDSAGGCFAGDTLIALADGRDLSFLEIIAEQAEGKEHFCYTVRYDGSIGVERIINPRMTKRSAEVIRVTLDTGEEIVCTPDHRFMLREGTYKAAIQLTPGESLMPLYFDQDEPQEVLQPFILAGEFYNHQVRSVEVTNEMMDVYDIEVPNTHNFALSSGVFVHNSAKQGRDRHFQAILPLRGKILNTERATINKILDNNEVRALISALGTGIRDDFDVSKLRYHRIISMSVAGDEPTLVMNQHGAIELVAIGEFIDDCVEGRRQSDQYQVMCFDLKTHQTRFRPLKAAIRHEHQEAMYQISTRYHRSVKVTASHSVFVLEDGQLKLKKGNEIRRGDEIVASRRLPRSANSLTQLDLLTLFHQNELAHALYVQGPSVAKVARQRVLGKMTRPDLWAEAKVELSETGWQQLIHHRQAQGLSQKEVAHSIGVKQPITISHWERTINRPILSQFNAYINAIGYSDALDYQLTPSKLDGLLVGHESSNNARWREVSDYKPLSSFTSEELSQLDDDVMLVPQAHSEKTFGRYLSITPELVWFLGWFVAEGTLSKHQVSLNIGEKDAGFIPELIAAVESVFGETPRCYQTDDSLGIKFYFHSVAAARLLKALGLAQVAHHKRLPDFVYGLSEELQYTFLEGYFLGDGTANNSMISMTTNSPILKDGLLYLLGQLGLIASAMLRQPATAEDVAIQTRHPFYVITMTGKSQLAQGQSMWMRHSNAPKLYEYLAKPAQKSLAYTPISDDLMGLEVLEVEEIQPVGQYVYDFSVETDENFICGVGGLCAHNTDADVDGSHIRTLLLTFFFRYMKPLIENGHLYVAQPPIYSIRQGKDMRYYYPRAGETDAQVLARGLKDFKDPEKAHVQRYKGLGEMNPDQLWTTTMNPDNRQLLRVTIEDAAEADRTFDMLMGNEVAPRRKFIQTHARSVRNLDI